MGAASIILHMRPGLCKLLRKLVLKPTHFLESMWPKGPIVKAHVPKGYVPVYVGEFIDSCDLFLLKAQALNWPCMAPLLEHTAQEFGYSSHGALRILCPSDTFKRILN